MAKRFGNFSARLEGGYFCNFITTLHICLRAEERASTASNNLIKRKKKSREREMAEEGAVIGCHTVDQWKQQLEHANESKKLVVVDFTASWCGPCRMIAPVFTELAKKFTSVLFLKVDVDELKSVAKDWNIEAMPTFVFLKEGTTVDKIVGAHKDELPKKIELHLSK